MTFWPWLTTTLPVSVMVLLQIVNAEVAAGVLVLGDDGDAAARFDAADILRALRRRRRLVLVVGRGERRFARCRLPDRRTRPASGISSWCRLAPPARCRRTSRSCSCRALRASGLDLDRLILVLGPAAWPCERRCLALRQSRAPSAAATARAQRERQSSASSLLVAAFSAVLVRLQRHGDAAVEADHVALFDDSSRLALRMPLSSFTQTGLSETTLPLLHVDHRFAQARLRSRSDDASTMLSFSVSISALHVVDAGSAPTFPPCSCLPSPSWRGSVAVRRDRAW